MGFAQAPCPALLLSEPRAKLPLTVTGAIWLVLGKKPAKLVREPQKLLWPVGWETACTRGGLLKARGTFKAKTGAYLYNHTRKCSFCYLCSHSLSRMGTKHHSEMGLMLGLTTTPWLSRAAPSRVGFDYVMGKAAKPLLFNSLRCSLKNPCELPILWASAARWAGMRLSHLSLGPHHLVETVWLFSLLHTPPMGQQKILSTERLTKASRYQV